jgi:hypothetical protein
MQPVGKMQRFLMMKEVVHIVTAVFLGIKECVKYKSILSKMSRDSVVGIAAGYRLDDRGVGVSADVG